METFKICWYRSYGYQESPHVRQHLMSILLEAKEGRQKIVVQDETRGTEFRWSDMQVQLTRWSQGWIVQSWWSQYDHYQDDEYGGSELVSSQPERLGTKWLVLDDQPAAFTWLEFDRDGDAMPHILLTTSDGRLVHTGCGPQVDPDYRKSVRKPEEALQVPWFNLPGSTGLPGDVPWELLEDAAKEAGILAM